MEKQIRQYTPDSHTTPGAGVDNPAATGSDVSGSQGMRNATDDDISGPIKDSDEDDSGISRRGKDVGTLTGTDKDETGPGENMATES